MADDKKETPEAFMTREFYAHASHLPLADGGLMPLDRDGDGRVTRNELSDVINDPKFKFDISPQQLLELKGMARKGDEVLVSEEQIRKDMDVVRPIIGDKERTFKKFDLNGDGKVTTGEFEKVKYDAANVPPPPDTPKPPKPFTPEQRRRQIII
jgi:hypothetical protein